jgi:gamma-polyglutamate biosynthesis protein CapA
VRIELTTPNLPSWCSTTELSRQYSKPRLIIPEFVILTEVKIILVLLTLLLGFFIISKEVVAPTADSVPFPSSSPEVVNQQVSLLFTGDIMLGRSVNITSLEKSDPTYPFQKVAKELKEADITFINLENPIVTDCPRIPHGFTFCADPQMVKGLTYAGVDVASLANNHTLNYGKDGFSETKDYLTQAGIDYVGDHNLAIKSVKGTTFGFLGFDKAQQSSPELSIEEVQLIESSDKKVDILIIGMHWGVEYQDRALPGVQNLAKKLVELGADVVVGNHPHWIQNTERINGKPIFYSLGNFIFDQMWSEETRKGMAIKLTFDGKEIIKEEKLPVYIREIGQPEFTTN